MDRSTDPRRPPHWAAAFGHCAQPHATPGSPASSSSSCSSSSYSGSSSPSPPSSSSSPSPSSPGRTPSPEQRVKVIVTGFGPFAHFDTNASWQSAESLDGTVMLTPPPPLRPRTWWHSAPLPPPTAFPSSLAPLARGDLRDQHYATIPGYGGYGGYGANLDDPGDEDVFIPAWREIEIEAWQVPVSFRGCLEQIPRIHGFSPWTSGDWELEAERFADIRRRQEESEALARGGGRAAGAGTEAVHHGEGDGMIGRVAREDGGAGAGAGRVPEATFPQEPVSTSAPASIPARPAPDPAAGEGARSAAPASGPLKREREPSETRPAGSASASVSAPAASRDGQAAGLNGAGGGGGGPMKRGRFDTGEVMGPCGPVPAEPTVASRATQHAFSSSSSSSVPGPAAVAPDRGKAQAARPVPDVGLEPESRRVAVDADPAAEGAPDGPLRNRPRSPADGRPPGAPLPPPLETRAFPSLSFSSPASPQSSTSSSSPSPSPSSASSAPLAPAELPSLYIHLGVGHPSCIKLERSARRWGFSTLYPDIEDRDAPAERYPWLERLLGRERRASSGPGGGEGADGSAYGDETSEEEEVVRRGGLQTIQATEWIALYEEFRARREEVARSAASAPGPAGADARTPLPPPPPLPQQQQQQPQQPQQRRGRRRRRRRPASPVRRGFPGPFWNVLRPSELRALRVSENLWPQVGSGHGQSPNDGGSAASGSAMGDDGESEGGGGGADDDSEAGVVGQGAGAEGEEMLTTLVDVLGLEAWLKGNVGVTCLHQSHDAGRYMCEFLYFASLACARKRARLEGFPDEQAIPVLFVHVPPEGDPYTVAELRLIIQNLIWACVNEGFAGM